MATFHLGRESIDALLEGLAIFGTGGGGSPAWGRAILENEFDRGRQPQLIDLEEVDDRATVVSGGLMGSVKVLDQMGIENVMRHWDERYELLEAARVMEGILGRPIDHVVPFEVGGLNTPAILSLGARMGIQVIDGDALGRSAPETQMTSFLGHGVSLTPMPLVDMQGNVVIVQKGVEPTFADQVGRFVISRGGGLGGNNHYPMSGAKAKQVVVPNSISTSITLGAAVLEARQSGRDPVETVAKHVGGTTLFVGDVTSLAEEESLGFYFTTAVLRGRNKFDHLQAELVIKNESMMLSVDGAPKAFFPDLILLLDPETGRGIMSVELKPGSRVCLVGLPCHPRLRSSAESASGRLSFSPARYGRPQEAYRPIESLVPQLVRT